jgi:Fe-S cluster assembly protein SufD
LLPLDHATWERVTTGRSDAARDRARRGLEAFDDLPMPDPREEDWRYVDVPGELTDLALPESAGSPASVSHAALDAFTDTAGSALVIDGHTVQVDGDLSPIADAAPGLSALEPAVVPVDLDRFAAAHHAFGGDGVFVHVPAGATVDRPFMVEFQAVTAGSVSFPRLAVVAEQGARAEVVVVQRSADGLQATVVPHIEVVAGDDARVGITTVQDWGDATVAVAQHRMRAERDAFVGLSEVGTGAKSARLHLTIDLAGRGADARVLGVSFGAAEQTLDYRAFVNHQAPNTTSEMFLKGAVGDTARFVFTGLIRIEPEGQRTNAHQTNRNLVLSEGAEAHSVPNLEILANDVRCGHGSAVGPLDEEQRYYLMSRGLDRARADRLQVKGFFEEVLTRFPRQELEPPMRSAFMEKYDGVVAREAQR